jgi:Tol biopolymer transport system component
MICEINNGVNDKPKCVIRKLQIMKVPYFTFLFLLFLSFSCTKETSSNLMLLDANIPTDTPLVFGKGIISTTNYEFAITFSPEMDELYFTRRKPGEDNTIYTMKLTDGQWSHPEPAIFTATEGWDFEPHISPNGDKLYFGSTRPLPDASKSNGLHQWYSTATKNGWSNPIPLESPFMDKSIIMYLTSSKNENLYFTTGEKGDKPEDWVIYNSIKEDGQYKSIDRMGNEINDPGKWVAHSFIAPDESYMLYDFKSDSGYGESDLYISFNKNRKWTKPYNLGPKLNTNQTEMAASVSPDGKYLFFHRGNENEGTIYWVAFKPLKDNILKKINNQ